MTKDEAKRAIEELKADGKTEKEIMGAIYEMFAHDEIDFEELEALANLMGYEITEEFREMSPEEQKTKGYEKVADPEAQEKEEKLEEINNEKENPEDEEDEEEKAKKLFGLDK